VNLSFFFLTLTSYICNAGANQLWILLYTGLLLCYGLLLLLLLYHLRRNGCAHLTGKPWLSV
jgi:hypothetical protein